MSETAVTVVLQPGRWYSLKDIAAALTVGYDRIRGMADADGVRDFMNTRKSETGRGVIYDYDSAMVFRTLLHAQDEGKLTPRTAAGYLRTLEASGQLGNSANGLVAQTPKPPTTLQNGPLTPLSVQIELTPARVLDSVRDGQEAGAYRAVKEDSERWYTLKEAHDAMGVSLTALHRISFKEGGRRKVRKSDVLQYMAAYRSNGQKNQ